MTSNKKSSSSLKVGILTVAALVILIFTVLWIKGRSLSSGERIEIVFHDVNGIRAGSGVQMMGLRIGQIEEIIPVVDGKDSHVKVRFVITEKDVVIPEASTISIQQSGLIGEQFLEVMPPKTTYVYAETSRSTTDIEENEDIYMLLSNKFTRIGKVDSASVVPTSSIPLEYKASFKTPNALKIGYITELPGLLLDNANIVPKIEAGKLVFKTKNNEEIELPEVDAPYTVIEPLRISDFLELQYEAAHSLASMNDRVMEILSDEFVTDIKNSVKSVNDITKKAESTVEKASLLLDSSKDELESILKQTNTLTYKLNILSDNINEITGDKEARQTLYDTIKSVGKFTDNVNKIIEKDDTKEIMTNLTEISRNLADISCYVNEFTSDENLKKNLKETIESVNSAMKEVNVNLQKANEANPNEQLSINNAISDAIVTTRNLKKFSEKLNKRFLIFRLMF